LLGEFGAFLDPFLRVVNLCGGVVDLDTAKPIPVIGENRAEYDGRKGQVREADPYWFATGSCVG
jgi:hypothetical protein